jgi:hypothetical protein
MTGQRQPRSVRLLVHDGRGHPQFVVLPGPPADDAYLAGILGIPVEEVQGSLYVPGRYGRARRRVETVAVVRRRLWALRLLLAAWMTAIGVTLWLVVDWAGWTLALFTHPLMLVLLLLLVHAARAERRWLARIRAAARR